MTSLQSYLPPRGSSNWHRSGSFTIPGENPTTSIRHVIIREVWLEKRPSPHAIWLPTRIWKPIIYMKCLKLAKSPNNVYKVEIMSNSSHWFVFRRYKEFYNLHQKLMKKFLIPKDFLPPKKLTNNMAIETLEIRREALEHYLQKLINSCDRDVSTCPELLEFLDLKGHDVSLVVMSLSKYLATHGQRILEGRELFTMTPVQLHCISKQLQLPHPSKNDEKVNLGHLYDFISELGRLCITDLVSKATHGKQFEINYSYDMTVFTKLTELQIEGCRLTAILGVHSLPQKLKSLTVRYCVHTMKEFLIDCAAEKRKAPDTKNSKEAWRAQAAYKLSHKRIIVQPWVCLMYLNMTHNNILGLDNSISLLPALRELDLSYNKMAHLDLSLLEESPLQKLLLVGNEIYLISGSTKTLVNLKVLNLKQNRIQSIEGLLCAQGLTALDLSHNSIVILSEVRKLAALENLRKLSVVGNPMAKQKRHRIMIFASFRDRELELDGREIGRKEKAKLDAKFSSEDDVDFDDTMSISTVSDDDLDSGIDGHVPSLEPLLEESDYIAVDKDVNLGSLSMADAGDCNAPREGSCEGSPYSSPVGSPKNSRKCAAPLNKMVLTKDLRTSKLESFSGYEESLAANWKPGTHFLRSQLQPKEGSRNLNLQKFEQQGVRKRTDAQSHTMSRNFDEDGRNSAVSNLIKSKTDIKAKGNIKKNPSLTSFDKLVRNSRKKEKRHIVNLWHSSNDSKVQGSSQSFTTNLEDSVDTSFKDNSRTSTDSKNVLVLPEIDELKVEDAEEDELWNGEQDCEAGTECEEDEVNY